MSDKKDENLESETENEKLEKRRKALKNILAGSGTVVTAAAMQDKWAKPVIESVVLPAHAQTSGVDGSFTAGNNTQNDSDLMDVLVPSANAACIYQFCINVSGGVADIQVYDDGVVSTGSAKVPFNIALSPSGNNIQGSYDPDSDQIVGTYSGTCFNGPYQLPRSTASCSLTGGTTVNPTTYNPSTTPYPTTYNPGTTIVF